MLRLCCQDFILEHYSEDGNNYEDEIADLMDLRQVMYTHSLTWLRLPFVAAALQLLSIMLQIDHAHIVCLKGLDFPALSSNFC